MAEERRSWEEIRRAAILAVIAAATDFGHDDLIAGNAEQLADAALAVCDEEVINRIAETFVNETRVKAIDFRKGVSMDLVPSETIVANWVAAAKTWLDHHQAPNYTETAVEFDPNVSVEVKLAGEFERYAFILQRVGPGKLTPHEARRRAEAERDEALAELAALKEHLLTEYGFQMSGGGWQTMNTEDYILKMYPLADQISGHQRSGAVYRRRVAVVEDWKRLRRGAKS